MRSLHENFVFEVEYLFADAIEFKDAKILAKNRIVDDLETNLRSALLVANLKSCDSVMTKLLMLRDSSN
ncbi:MAG: hypothetical protein EOP04_31115 [Proteobacteria bacterium]|nr:MAG: hypothetical protein EOP04_31115 [Pseudomonadota bacterium]